MQHFVVLILAILPLVTVGQEEDCPGECKFPDSSGALCGLHDFRPHNKTCTDPDAVCCLTSCDDTASPCGGGCFDGPTCPEGRVLYTQSNCACHEESKVCCRMACSQDDTCVTNYQGRCTYEECEEDEKKRTDLCSKGENNGKGCHCCAPKGKGHGAGVGGGGDGLNSQMAGERGDPKMMTHDGHKFFLKGKPCAYTLMRECANVTQMADFTVICEHTRSTDEGGINVKGLIAEFKKRNNVWDETCKIEFEGFDSVATVQIDDETPLEFHKVTNRTICQELGLYIKRIGKESHPHILVGLRDKFEMIITPRGGVYFKLLAGLKSKEHHKQKVCGLLGNADGNPENDFMKYTPHGLKQVAKMASFATEAQITDFETSWIKNGTCNDLHAGEFE